MPIYNLEKDSPQFKFHASKAKVQIFGGGFGNGKTAAGCIKAIKLAMLYPGCNGLIARATFPKLNDTIRKEFFKWLPPEWIKSFNKSDNVLVLTNGSTINFRYIAQQGKNGEQSTSNLLSATYDWILIDQVEDPEIVHKDFMDLLGRLRGNTRYDAPRGQEDESMPKDGCRWMMLLCNPTRNWVYRKLIKPLHHYLKTGIKLPDLLVHVETGEPIIHLIEGSTYTNQRNLGKDFIQTLEATYTAQMKSRFVDGEWGAYEGLVYPDYEYDVHTFTQSDFNAYLQRLTASRVIGKIKFIEGYDYGIQAPCCYLIGMTDHKGNVFVVDGFYVTGKSIKWQADKIREIRAKFNLDDEDAMRGDRLDSRADPSIFRRTAEKTGAGYTVASMFEDEGIYFSKGSNDIASGVTKIIGYLRQKENHQNPLTGMFNAPHIYINDKLWFIDHEISDYYWKKDSSGDATDKPVDKNDHALDTIKFMLSNRPDVATINTKYTQAPAWTRWGEVENSEQYRGLPRHG